MTGSREQGNMSHELDWIGPCHELVERFLYMANGYSGIRSRRIFHTDPPSSPEQIQVLQYLIEHDADKLNMTGIADVLGMTKSTFTKLVFGLELNGIVEKKYLGENRKNKFLHVTPKGLDLYRQYVERYGKAIFSPFFEKGAELDEAQLSHFTSMVDELNRIFIFNQSNLVDIAKDLSFAAAAEETVRNKG